MARMAQSPKSKAKKNVSPVTVAVVVIVVLALIVVVYSKFGKETKGLDMNDPQVKKMMSEMQRAGGGKGIRGRMQAMRSRRLGAREGRHRAPRVEGASRAPNSAPSK